MKNKHHFLRLAILKTMGAGLLYLAMPLAAKFYHHFVGSEYFGYTVFGAGIMITGNIILLVRAWILAFDPDARKSYYKKDE